MTTRLPSRRLASAEKTSSVPHGGQRRVREEADGHPPEPSGRRRQAWAACYTSRSRRRRRGRARRPFARGDVAQLGEHRVRIAGVGVRVPSSPPLSITARSRRRRCDGRDRAVVRRVRCIPSARRPVASAACPTPMPTSRRATEPRRRFREPDWPRRLNGGALRDVRAGVRRGGRGCCGPDQRRRGLDGCPRGGSRVDGLGADLLDRRRVRRALQPGRDPGVRTQAAPRSSWLPAYWAAQLAGAISRRARPAWPLRGPRATPASPRPKLVDSGDGGRDRGDPLPRCS